MFIKYLKTMNPKAPTTIYYDRVVEPTVVGHGYPYEATELFGNEKDNCFLGVVGSLVQPFGGQYFSAA